MNQQISILIKISNYIKFINTKKKDVVDSLYQLPNLEINMLYQEK